MDELHLAVERDQGCRATFLTEQTVTVPFADNSCKVSRFIKTFTLHNHPSAKKAFAWLRGENPHPDEPAYTVVLSAPGIKDAKDALMSKVCEVYKRM